MQCFSDALRGEALRDKGRCRIMLRYARFESNVRSPMPRDCTRTPEYGMEELGL